MSVSCLGRSVSSLGLLVLVLGCGPARPARVVAPPLDVAAITAGLLAKGDANGNGRIEAAEFARVPALAEGLAILDTDGDKAISAAEITGWLDRVVASEVAVTSVPVAVKHKGKPIEGALVKFIPEPFMGSSCKPAEGTTDKHGQANITIPGAEFPGVTCGVYRVEISGTGNNGKPLPAKYNKKTTLGIAVGALLPQSGMPTFTLE
jgi:hypothetical protein